MCTLKHRFLTWALAVVLTCASPLGMVSAASYSGGTGFDFGVIPGYPAMNNAAGVEPILDVGISFGGGPDLGCAGIDLFGYIETTFNFNFNVDRFVNNLKTKVAKWALTQMMATPQIAAVFDTLNQMENFRWDMFNENCDIGEVKEEAKKWFIKDCAKKPGMSEIKCQEQYEAESVGYLKRAAEKWQKILESVGSMESVLKGTSFCEDKETREKSYVCGLMGFIPTMQFCHTSSSGGGLGCAKIGDIDIGETPLGFPFLLDAATSVFGEKVYNSNANMIENMASNMGIDEIKLLARKAVAAGDPPAPDISTLGKLSKEYIGDVGCSNWDPLARQRQLASLAGGGYTVPPYAAHKTQVESILESSGLSQGLSAMKAADAKEAKEMMVVAVGCVANHEVPLSTETEILLLSKPRSTREEFRQAVAIQASVIMVKRVMSFVENKLKDAKSQLGDPKEHMSYFDGGGCEGDPIPDDQVVKMKAEGTLPSGPCEDIQADKYEMPRKGLEIMISSLKQMQIKLEDKEKTSTWWAEKGRALRGK